MYNMSYKIEDRNKTVLRTKYFMTLFLALIFFIMISQTESQRTIAQDTTNFSNYQNSSYGISIDYPSNWILKEKISPENVVAFRTPFNASVVGISISVQDLSLLLDFQNMSLKDYSSLRYTYLNDKSMAGYIDKITYINYYTISNNPADSVEYLISEPTSGKIVEYWMVKNDKAYIITVFIPANTENQIMPTVKKIVDSFKITK